MRNSLGQHTPNTLWRTLWIPLFILFSVRPSAAEFFWRLPRRAETVLEQLGGMPVYETPIQVNGAPGTLTAHAFTGQTASGLAAQIARRLGLPVPPTAPGGTMLTHDDKTRLTKYLVLPSPSGHDSCVTLAIAAKGRPPSTPTGWPAQVPALNAEPRFTAVCEKTRTGFVTAESALTPEAALADATTRLAQAGWREAFSAGASCKIFTLNSKQCIVFASAESGTGRTSVSLLCREGAVTDGR
ncbi:MAG: hypothetical protein J6334_12070 [Kiritimatiellae bacterium]|nr:hypothetical protein [Kiritimatiellia bacterium]